MKYMNLRFKKLQEPKSAFIILFLSSSIDIFIKWLGKLMVLQHP